jgi:hypothetical protein
VGKLDQLAQLQFVVALFGTRMVRLAGQKVPPDQDRWRDGGEHVSANDEWQHCHSSSLYLGGGRWALREACGPFRFAAALCCFAAFDK